MAFNTCSVCNQLFWNRDTHQCPPAWMVYLDADGYTDDDAQRFYANDPEAAACDFAARYDNGYYALLNGGEIDVIVFLASDPNEKFLYTVKGETIPSYYISDV